ncbi:MAG: hypothetical protein ABEH90_06910 [Halolamina sp.]
MSDGGPAAAAREHLLAAHADAIDAVLDAADAVATVDVDATAPTNWFRLDDGRPATTDRDALVPALRAELETRGARDVLPALLSAAVDAAGYDLAATPVPAPPYVTVTSTGPVLRATVADGRLVVRIDCFDVVRGVKQENGTGVAYARSASEPAAALSVTFVPAE